MLAVYLKWHFFESPKEILKAWGNFLRFNLNYFSITLLLKTFFSPWHNYRWFYPRGFSPSRYFEVFVSNMTSRVIGAILRLFLIIIGLIVEAFIMVVGIAAFFVWLALPFLLLAGLWFGINLIITA